MLNEGVIKYELVHRDGRLDRAAGALARSLGGWRHLLRTCELIGQRRDLYDGAGYGNLSLRPNGQFRPPGRRSFLITGTQTSGRDTLTLEDYAWVERYDYRANRLESRGLAQPSSEALTHGAVYDLEARIEAVFHAHSHAIWSRAEEFGLPITDPSVPYGTPEMAFEVRRLYRLGSLRNTRLFAMGGHEDGVVAFGGSLDEAGGVLLRWLAQALTERDCDQVAPS